MGAFAAAAVLSLLRAADERETIRSMPWGVILMVCGVTVLTALLETTGGIDLFSSILARFSTRRSVTGLIALVTGLVSVYSSTSGVVLPTFLPSVPGLIQNLGGGNPLAISSSVLIGGHLVDVSPLSTIGALCVAGAAASEDRRLLFNRLQPPAERLCPDVAGLDARLAGLGPAGRLMSGSGSTVFALCRDPAEALRVARALRPVGEEGAGLRVFVVRSCV